MSATTVPRSLGPTYLVAAVGYGGEDIPAGSRTQVKTFTRSISVGRRPAHTEGRRYSAQTRLRILEEQLLLRRRETLTDYGQFETSLPRQRASDLRISTDKDSPELVHVWLCCELWLCVIFFSECKRKLYIWF